jgi:hypothetical protein
MLTEGDAEQSPTRFECSSSKMLSTIGSVGLSCQFQSRHLEAGARLAQAADPGLASTPQAAFDPFAARSALSRLRGPRLWIYSATSRTPTTSGGYPTDAARGARDTRSANRGRSRRSPSAGAGGIGSGRAGIRRFSHASSVSGSTKPCSRIAGYGQACDGSANKLLRRTGYPVRRGRRRRPRSSRPAVGES